MPTPPRGSSPGFAPSGRRSVGSCGFVFASPVSVRAFFALLFCWSVLALLGFSFSAGFCADFHLPPGAFPFSSSPFRFSSVPFLMSSESFCDLLVTWAEVALVSSDFTSDCLLLTWPSSSGRTLSLSLDKTALALGSTELTD